MERLFSAIEPGWQYAFFLATAVMALALVRNFLDELGFVRISAKAAVKCEAFLLGSLLIVMITTAIIQILLRNFFASGIAWVDPLQRSIVLWIGFLGATMATKQGRHISIDALSRFFTGTSQLTVRIVTDLAATIVSIILSSAAYTFLHDEWGAGDRTYLGLYTWMIAFIIPLGFGIISYRFFYRVISHFKELTQDAEPEIPDSGEEETAAS